MIFDRISQFRCISGDNRNFKTTPGNFLILCGMVLPDNINFLSSKQIATSRFYPKILQQ